MSRSLTASVKRVASRHIEKRAGLLKAPPAMVKEITEWVQTNVSRWLATTDKVRVSEEVREIARKKGGSGRPETKTTFYVDLKGWPYLRSFGKTTDRVLAKVEQQIEKAVAARAEGTVAEPTMEIEVPLFLRRLFTLNPNTRMTPEEVRRLVKKVDQMPSHQVAEAALPVLPEGFIAVDVVIVDRESGGNVKGSWNGGNHTITIYPSAYLRDVPTARPPYRGITFVYEYPKLLGSLATTVNHELQHMTQDIIKVLAGLHEDGGLPSRRIRDVGYTSDGRVRDERGQVMPTLRKEYLLRDVEFYTWLEGEINDFHDSVERDSRLRSVWDEARKAWVGGRSTLTFKRSKPFELVPDPIEVSPFFRALRENEPAKWRKAVGEFWKATEQPQSSRVASLYAAKCAGMKTPLDLPEGRYVEISGSLSSVGDE